MRVQFREKQYLVRIPLITLALGTWMFHPPGGRPATAAPQLPSVNNQKGGNSVAKIGHSYVWHISSPTGDKEFSRLAAAALGDKQHAVTIKRTPTAARPAGRCRLVLVGPEPSKNPALLASQLKRMGLPLVGIGEAGLDVLSRIDTHFATGEPEEGVSGGRADLRALRIVFSPYPMPDWAQGGALMRVPFYQTQGKVVWTLGLKLDREKLAPLIDSESQSDLDRRACAGWSGNLGFWGLVDPQMSPQARQVFAALIRRVSPSP